MLVETELEALMKRLVPGCESAWEGASPQELEALAEETLADPPPFYDWFLRTMGRSMGPLASKVQDTRIETILSMYRSSRIYPDLDHLLVAFHPEDIAPRVSLYDLRAPCRDDAMVVSAPEDRPDQRRPDFETMREMLAWQLMLRFAVQPRPFVCDLDLYSDSDPVLDALTPVMAAQGFTTPIATGSYCGLFEAEQSTLVGHTTPKPPKEQKLFCVLGADSEALARQIVGKIGTETALRVEVSRWHRSTAG